MWESVAEAAIDHLQIAQVMSPPTETSVLCDLVRKSFPVPQKHHDPRDVAVGDYRADSVAR